MTGSGLIGKISSAQIPYRDTVYFVFIICWFLPCWRLVALLLAPHFPVFCTSDGAFFGQYSHRSVKDFPFALNLSVRCDGALTTIVWKHDISSCSEIQQENLSQLFLLTSGHILVSWFKVVVLCCFHSTLFAETSVCHRQRLRSCRWWCSDSTESVAGCGCYLKSLLGP